MTAQFPAHQESAAPAGWHIDPDDPHVMRWWNGHDWGKDVKPRLVLAAEDQTRILADQARMLAEIRNHVAAVRNIMTAWAILTVIGVIGYLLAVNR